MLEVIAARRLLIAVNASAAKTASEADAVLCGLPRREYDANVLDGAVPTTLGTMTTSSAAHDHLVNPVYTATKTRFAHIENLVHMRIRVVTTSFTLRHGTFLFAFFVDVYSIISNVRVDTPVGRCISSH